MTAPVMLDNILAQPASHRAVLTLHQGGGANLRACAEKIRNNQGRVIVSGMGGSLFAALAAVSHLQQQGYLVQAVESAELLHYGSASLRAADLGIVVSRSGESIEPVLLAEKMRDAGMTVLAVTDVPGSKLEQIAHLTLPIGSQADELIAVQTYTGTLLTLLLLAEEVLAGDSEQFHYACAAALPALSAHIDRCLRAGRFLARPADGRYPLPPRARTGACLCPRRSAPVARNSEDGGSWHVLRSVSPRAC